MKKIELMELAEKLDLKVNQRWIKKRIEDAVWKKINDLRLTIELDIAHHLKLSRSYFWKPPSSASGRRLMEKQNSYTQTIKFDGLVYEFQSSVDVSCTNVYYTGHFFKDGKKKNVKLWRDLLLQLETIGV